MRAEVASALAIAGLHALLCVAARASGLDHVSDDDFARVTIAQAFAHAPRLDPSGTSWLPFPFWILGGAMAVLGRSLFVARLVSIAVASLAAATPYLALRFAGVPRRQALLGTAFAFATPWAIWLGGTTVPESFTASLTAASAIGLTATLGSTEGSTERGRSALVTILFALAALAACLSRYESWPAAAVLALGLAWHARRMGPGAKGWVLAATLCAIGPIAWMAWNAHAHDGPLHFFRRVSGFKRAMGAGSSDTLVALLLYPRLLITHRPEVTLLAIALLPSVLRDPAIRRRWGLPLLCAAAQVVFLAYGNARDGAPAHHPERALLGTLLILALFAGDVGWTRLQALVEGTRRKTGQVVCAGVLALWATSIVRGSSMPGLTANDDRRAQVQAGERLREHGYASVVITPCAYEHFALIAAFGRPEDADVRPSTGAALGPACPAVEWH